MSITSQLAGDSWNLDSDPMKLLRRAVRVGHDTVSAEAGGRPLDEFRSLMNAARMALVRGRRDEAGTWHITQLAGSGWAEEGHLRAWSQAVGNETDPMNAVLCGKMEIVTRRLKDLHESSQMAGVRSSRITAPRLGLGDGVVSGIGGAVGGRFMLLAAYRLDGDLRQFAPFEAVLLDVVMHVMQPSFVEGDRLDLEAAEAMLTPRVREVLRKLLAGYSEKEIASQLKVAPCTVHSHVVSIYRTLNVGSRAELMSLLLNGTRRNGVDAGGAR